MEARRAEGAKYFSLLLGLDPKLILIEIRTWCKYDAFYIANNTLFHWKDLFFLITCPKGGILQFCTTTKACLAEIVFKVNKNKIPFNFRKTFYPSRHVNTFQSVNGLQRLDWNHKSVYKLMNEPNVDIIMWWSLVVF